MNKPIKLTQKQTLLSGLYPQRVCPFLKFLDLPSGKTRTTSFPPKYIDFSLRTVQHEAEHSTSHHSKNVSKSQGLDRDEMGMCFLRSSSPWTKVKDTKAASEGHQHQQGHLAFTKNWDQKQIPLSVESRLGKLFKRLPARGASLVTRKQHTAWG